MKESIKFFLGFIPMVYGILTLASIIMGMGDITKECDTYPTKRIHYAFPLYKFGCWLSEDINEKK